MLSYHNLEEDGVIESEERVVSGKICKYYSITETGEEIFTDVKKTNS